jgi:hypothetical protein
MGILARVDAGKTRCRQPKSCCHRATTWRCAARPCGAARGHRHPRLAPARTRSRSIPVAPSRTMHEISRASAWYNRGDSGFSRSRRRLRRSAAVLPCLCLRSSATPRQSLPSRSRHHRRNLLAHTDRPRPRDSRPSSLVWRRRARSGVDFVADAALSRPDLPTRQASVPARHSREPHEESDRGHWTSLAAGPAARGIPASQVQHHPVPAALPACLPTQAR